MLALRRPLIFLLSLFLAAGVASTAMAQGAGGQGGGGQGAGGQGSGRGNAGVHEAPAETPATSPAAPEMPGKSPFRLPWIGQTEQDKALDALRAEKALPLDEIITAARRFTQGQVIDAQLDTVDGTLLYKLQVIEETGDVREFSFLASSGELIRIR